MNIFFLDEDPVMAARMMVDSHISKMITESAQILSNCYTLVDLLQAPPSQNGNPRKHSYPHHPCCKWVKECIENFWWVVDHAYALQDEKWYRWPDKKNSHYSLRFIDWCSYHPPSHQPSNIVPTTPALAMKAYPECMDPNDPVTSYRKFYVKDKKFNAAGKPMDVYTRRERPKFWEQYDVH